MVAMTREGAKTRILFVDDEVGFTEAMSKVLASHSFDVKTANSGSSAVDIFSKEEFDLVITDLNMPNMDGIELIRRIRDIKPEQQILIVTGFPSHESQEEAFKMGVENYIVKPFSTKRFLELVSKSLKEAKNGVRGAVEITTTDLIQMYALNNKSLILEIRDGKRIGRIYFSNGKVIHAETSKFKGVKAFFNIQTWNKGTFSEKPLDDNIKPTINQSVESLLLEGVRLQDENQRKIDTSDVPKDGVKIENLLVEELFSNHGDSDNSKNKRRHSMPSMIEEINGALKELADNTPGLSLALLVDNEGLPIGRYASMQIQEGAAEKVAVASLALLGLARRTADQLDLEGFQEVLVKADTGYVYSLAVGGPANYTLVARTDQNVTLGALFMTVRSARERIDRAMGVGA